ncbi:DUF6807 domain-containing protein [Streptomyces zingiberis]|uniref:Oxidoreductase n=1 Tax=Streptomyces zingiberis TaxID=2053010 RepID=A0ABX1BXZ2_9ACTN|nr:PmoA family protein [Streptomyces zingiberis]NJQ02564.1 oxidoreductase [Streptomyces zingiberis]
MSAPVTLTHVHGERISVTSGGVELMAYVYRPDPEPYEAPKPYAHPLRTLAGHTVTGYRPNDHRHHKGLQMTASHLSGQNLWGGNSYLHGQGYRRVPERVGSMRHDGFGHVTAERDRVSFTERLTWRAHSGEEWAHERRDLAVHSADAGAGCWTLEWATELTNLRAEPLRFGSPTTAGREMAGYTGLHWRGPRDLTGGDVLGPEGRGGDGEAGAVAMMGTHAPWLAFTGVHDEVDARSTLVFLHDPANERAIHASHWFVRSEPAPSVAFSWAFFEEFALAPGESFAYRYRVLIADGAWDRERIAERVAAQRW